MIKAGIIGGAGYTAGELVRILVNHPECRIAFVQSSSNAGNRICDVHQGLVGETDLVFCESFDLAAVDVLFLCSGHGRSAAFWEEHPVPSGLKIIDLAQDYRDGHDGYVYGLPEWQKEKIASADKVANPGCFATCIQLALMPLAQAGLLDRQVNVTAITGSTGAGVKPTGTTHFSWRNNNVSTYKVLEHQHMLEINRNLGLISPKPVADIAFVPVRGDFARGIFASVILNCPELEEERAVRLFKDFYSSSAFTFVSDREIDLKEVVNTNKALVHVVKRCGKLVVSSVLDNLLKGASGQAVQNMNIMFGLDEKAGLKLKASAF